MWVNILTKESTKQFMLITDEEIGDGETYVLNSLLEDGWEEFCDCFHTHKKCKSFMKEFYPEYKLLQYETKPITFSEACNFVNQYHRHHVSPQGHKFSVAISDGEDLVGVAIAGRPVSRHRDDGKTIEITRLCVKAGYKNACSLLYAKACKIAKEMGYVNAITYTLESENGSSLEASGFQFLSNSVGGSWSSKSRYREDKHPTGMKNVWHRVLI